MEDVILALHFIGLAMGGAAAFGLPVVGNVLGRTAPEQRPAVSAAIKPLQMIGKAGMGVLILTGLAMAVMGNIWAQVPIWFWVKLVVVVCLIAGIVIATKAGALAQTGDVAAAHKAKRMGQINLSLLAVILICAALAFN